MRSCLLGAAFRAQLMMEMYDLDVDVDVTFGKQSEQLGKADFEGFLGIAPPANYAPKK